MRKLILLILLSAFPLVVYTAISPAGRMADVGECSSDADPGTEAFPYRTVIRDGDISFESPPVQRLDQRTARRVDSIMNAGLSAGYYPGASIAAGNSKGPFLEKQYGWQSHQKLVPVGPEDVYDIASLTKVVGTTFALMKLYDQGKIDLMATVGRYIKEYDDSEVSGITMTELLTHTSGLPYFAAYSIVMSNPAGGNLISTKYDMELFPHQIDRTVWLCEGASPDSCHYTRIPIEGYRTAGEGIYINPDIDTLFISRIKGSYDPTLRGRYRYSDTNFYILRQIVEKLSGEEFDDFVHHLFDQLDMINTGYRPLLWKEIENIIPTEEDIILQRGQLRGYVHDDLSAVRNGVEGNAGIFSTAEDLGHFCEMMINYGEFRGHRILSDRTVKLFTSAPLSARKIYRAYGFDKRAPDAAQLNKGYGHTGYTGTMLWIDPGNDIWMVFLSNRVNPTRLNNGLANSGLRAKLWDILQTSRVS